jgi:nucleotide-binding universal stress UspA family protein
MVVMPPLPSTPAVSRKPPAGPPGIVVGVDGSDGSMWALDRAFTEATALVLPLHVVAVVNPAPGGYSPGMADLVEESVERLLRGMSDVTVLALDTVEILLAASNLHHTMVVGARGNGGFARLLLGSVATALVHHGGCPVLVVPARNTGTRPSVHLPD